MKKNFKMLLATSFACALMCFAPIKANAEEAQFSFKSEPVYGACKVSWDAVPGADAYMIQGDRISVTKIKNSQKSLVQSVDGKKEEIDEYDTALTGTSTVIEIKDDNVLHDIKIVALKKGSVNGEYTTVGSSKEMDLYPIPHVKMSDDVICKTPTEWNKVKNVTFSLYPSENKKEKADTHITSFEVRVKNANGKVIEKKKYQAKDVKKFKMKLRKGSAYQYEVRATHMINGKKYQGEWSEPYIIAVPEKMDYTKEEDTSAREYTINASWSAIKNCKYYKITDINNKTSKKSKKNSYSTVMSEKAFHERKMCARPFVKVKMNGKWKTVEADSRLLFR